MQQNLISDQMQRNLAQVKMHWTIFPLWTLHLDGEELTGPNFVHPKPYLSYHISIAQLCKFIQGRPCIESTSQRSSTIYVDNCPCSLSPKIIIINIKFKHQFISWAEDCWYLLGWTLFLFVANSNSVVLDIRAWLFCAAPYWLDLMYQNCNGRI